MRNHKFLTLLISIVLIVILLFIVRLQPPGIPGLQGTADIASPVQEEQEPEAVEEVPEETVIEEPKETEQEAENKPITEEIKETVIGVVESALGLFIREDLNILAIGDSLTEGVGDSTNNGGYVGIIENTLEDNNESVEVINYGKRGNRSDQLLDRLSEPEISASVEEADIILITIGANDIMKVVKNNFTDLEYEPFAAEQENYERRLRTIFETMLAKNPDARIFLVGFYNPFEQYFSHVEQLDLIIDNWGAAASHIALDYEQVHYIPTKDLFQDAEMNLFAEDNFHPNEHGYLLMAQRVLEYIRPTIVQDQSTDRIGESSNGETATQQ